MYSDSPSLSPTRLKLSSAISPSIGDSDIYSHKCHLSEQPFEEKVIIRIIILTLSLL